MLTERNYPMDKKNLLIAMTGLFLLGSAAAMACTGKPQNSGTETGTENVTETPAETFPATGFVTAQEKDLFDESGKPLLLRGVNIGSWFVREFWMTPIKETENVRCEKELEEILTERFGEEKASALFDAYLDSYFTEKDFDYIKELGFNCIRLPLWYGIFSDAEGNRKPDAYRRVDWFVEEAASRGLYVILDMHGAYGSQNGSDHSGIDGRDNKKEASEFFFGENAEHNQELYYSLWEEITAHYKDNPAVAGYDLLNEPFCTYRYNSGLKEKDLHELLWPIYDEAYRRIRAVDPDHMILFEAVWDGGDLPSPEEYGWTNAMYEYHQYEYSNYWNENNAQIKSMNKKLRNIRQSRHNVPALMGEFNYFNNMDAWAEGLKILEESGTSWTLWSYKCMTDNDNWGLMRLSCRRINPETDSYETILDTWSKLDEAEENTPLVDVIKAHMAEFAK